MIKAESISFAFERGTDEVLSEFTATADAGRITVILGPNAAGKTTLLRILLGALKPSHGRVRFAEKPVNEWSATARARRLAYVSQVPRVDAPFRVRDVVELGTFAHAADASTDRTVREAMEACGISSIAERRYHDLSVGQQQRVSLARALAQIQSGGKGRALLLDEPMSAMDPRHAADAATLLREVAKRGTAVVMVLHDVTLAQAFGDHIWAMRDGRLLYEGSPNEVLTPARLEALYAVPFVSGRELGIDLSLPLWHAD